ncbi:hypothetical protein AAG570_005302 [Ranatra chinensis]|uniref:Ubiquitin-like domain-containing protein n=1 Tax=Ranatra chinensis TaxID=642074 RepID=A0ABD0Y0X3_9HEMI
MQVTGTTRIKELKQYVSNSLNVPVNQQKLVLTGRPLSDEKCLVDYPLIKDGTKINLIIKKCATDEDSVLRAAVTKFLRQKFTDNDTQKITDEFMKEFYRSMATLNLEDIERIAKLYLEEDKMS